MNITQEEKNGAIAVAISGRLDAVSAVDADKEFSKALDGEIEKMLINLKGLEYISSAGLRVLLVVAKRMQQKGGKVCLCCLADNVKEVFEISGFSSIFKIFDSEEDCGAFLHE
jgi:anti-anti-sigma factor